jgi:hypothetical protein
LQTNIDHGGFAEPFGSHLTADYTDTTDEKRERRVAGNFNTTLIRGSPLPL